MKSGEGNIYFKHSKLKFLFYLANVECVKLRNDCYQLKLASREKEVEHQQLLEEVKSLKVGVYILSTYC